LGCWSGSEQNHSHAYAENEHQSLQAFPSPLVLIECPGSRPADAIEQIP
jgi:hypothetical protein